MGHRAIESINAALAYVETHLREKPDLEKVACGVHYSKYHLHRTFTDTVGMTLHDYIRRRALSEAAAALVFSRKPILEIAQDAGYESQQAFTGIFKDMYKRTPLEYRGNGEFYPLQLAFTLNGDPSAFDEPDTRIAYAGYADMQAWMEFVPLVIDGFPCFDAGKHAERLKYDIGLGQVLLMRDKGIVVGGTAFSRRTGRIGFLGVHPQYRRYGIEKAFLDFIRYEIVADREISITTFRENDRADTGQRAAYRRLGFTEAELLTEFGYPVQRLILEPSDFSDARRRQNGGCDA